MRKIVFYLKSIIRPFIIWAKKNRLKQKLLSRIGIDSDYVFSEKDIDLYVAEKFSQLLLVSVSESDDPSLQKVTLGGKQVYWPSSLPTDDLPWLYHEIFDPFTENPSSYNHPGIGYKDREWVIDAGAAEGFFSVFALENSHGKLFCIEPLSVMKPALERTLVLYSGAGRSIVVTAALGEKPGLSEIQIDSKHICDSKILLNSSPVEPSEGTPITEKVPVFTIDQLVDQYSLEAEGVIKMDIEGFEMAALMGATNTMRRYKPALAIAVYHEPENAKKCAEIIMAANHQYKIEFRGYYGYFDPPRPYLIFAF
jgi:FkbM family methyltransferase